MKYLLLILKYLGPVLQAVTDVEKVIGAGNGSTKKQLVLDSLTAAAKVGQTVDIPEVAVIGAIVDTTVATLNASGIFKKTEVAVQTPQNATEPSASKA